MSRLLDGKVVLVNGGTQGVGAAVARAAVREGARVVVTGRRVDAGKQFTADVSADGADVRFVQADLADPDQAKATVPRTVAEFGRIDGLCNAAGLTTRGTLLDTTPELFDQHIAVNLRAPFFAMQAAVARGRLDRRGGDAVAARAPAGADGGNPQVSIRARVRHPAAAG